MFAPRFRRFEVERHKALLAQRIGTNPENLDAALAALYRRVARVSDADLEPDRARATKARGVNGHCPPSSRLYASSMSLRAA